MKKIAFLILFVLPLFMFSQKNKQEPCSDTWDKWNCIDYGRDIAKVYAEDAVNSSKAYFTGKLAEFQKHCATDSILVVLPTGWKIKYYHYIKPPPTFEYFMEWLQKNK